MSVKILECVNYKKDYVPNVEARSCPTNITNAGRSKFCVQSLCSGHYGKGSKTINTISSGDKILADIINQLIDEINNEINRRQNYYNAIKDNTNHLDEYRLLSNIEESYKVNIGDTCSASTMNKLYSAIQQMSSVENINNPVVGSIMEINNPNPVIKTLNSLILDCICYTDCAGYYVCNCYGYCNNY